MKTFSVPHPEKGKDRIQDLLRLHDEIKTYKVNTCLTSIEYILLDQRNITIPNSKDQDIFTGFITFQPSNGGIGTPKTSKGTTSNTEIQNRQLHQIISV